MKTVLAALCALGLSLVTWRWLPHPFLWGAGLWLAACFLAFRWAQRTSAKLVWVHLAAVVAAFGLAEMYLAVSRAWARERPSLREEGAVPYLLDELLGWTLPPNSTWTVAKYSGEALIYRVTYHTDSAGRRVGPPSDSPDGDCILFFGGSFTFGMGVEDTETMPYRVGEKSPYRVLNFGVGGYGPHQVLALIEDGRVGKSVDCAPRFAIFQGVNDHVARAAGKRSWARRGPYYEVLADGDVRRIGRLDDRPAQAGGVRRWLGDSLVFRHHFGDDPAVTEADVERYVALVQAAHRRLAEIFPGLSFHVLHWGSKHRGALEALPEAGIALHLIDDVLPDYNEDPLSYQLSPHDFHPNARAHERIAEYIVEQILAPASP